MNTWAIQGRATPSGIINSREKNLLWSFPAFILEEHYSTSSLGQHTIWISCLTNKPKASTCDRRWIIFHKSIPFPIALILLSIAVGWLQVALLTCRGIATSDVSLVLQVWKQLSVFAAKQHTVQSSTLWTHVHVALCNSKATKNILYNIWTYKESNSQVEI